MLSQTNFYKKYKEEIVTGLVAGLVAGLAAGLVVGLAWGLAWGLVVILTNFSEALPYFSIFPNWIFLILGIIILSEIMFFLMPKEKLKKGTNIFWHTCKRKFENIFEVLLALSGIAQIYILIREIQVGQYLPEILRWIGYIGAGIICLGGIAGILYLWIKLNSLKYRKC